ncbi:MAG: terminase small subunit [Clostridium sp.]|jgi:phage terminase small subunit|nr:terminase small subunit [Clostridium sp.]DAR72067.1 MAG TPA: Terminase small subunit [Caudoviricetes sp.]DAY69878.1 MAG TPA: Terminase small subunit [Caudoviricetes sp.]
MTEAQKRFCDEYLIDLNATRAYKVAYKRCKKDETANVNGSKLLRNTKVKEYILQKQAEIQKRTEITQDRVLKELAKIAFGDIRKLYTDNGALRNIVDLEDDIAGAISGVETFEEYEGRGAEREYIGDTKKVKMLDKTKALELLGKHLGMFKETNININTNYEEYLKRVEGNEY